MTPHPPTAPGPGPPGVAGPADPPPLAADPAAVAGSGERLLVASVVLDGCAAFAIDGGRVRGWEGAAARAAHAAAVAIGARAGSLGLALRHLAVRLLAHAGDLDRLLRDRAGLVVAAGELREATAALHADLARAAATPLGGLAGASLETRARALAAEVARHDRAVLAWTQEVRAAERDVVAACRTLTGPGDDLLAGGPVAPAPASPPPDPPTDPADVLLAALRSVLRGAAEGDRATAAGAWWAGLPEPARWSVLAAAPTVLGSLAGLPAAVRDRANRLAVALDLAVLSARERAGLLGAAPVLLPPVGGGAPHERLAHAEAAARALERAESRRDPRSGAPVRAVLWTHRPGAHGGDGEVVLAYGDPDAADHVAVLVPGLGTDAGSVVEKGDDAWAAYAAARSRTAEPVASLTWIGYDAPDEWLGGDLDAWGVVGDGLARAGGAALAHDLDALGATHEDDAHVTVVGHSYGSTTVAHGAVDPGLAADDVVLLGSPGAGPATRAGDLGVGDRVWVGSASSDPVTRIGDEGWVGGPGTLGRDPAAADFGARRFAAEDLERDVGLRWSPDQHRGYWEHGSEALAATSLVVAGRGEEVTAAPGRTDPWWRGPRDPEAARPVTRQDTGRW